MTNRSRMKKYFGQSTETRTSIFLKLLEDWEDALQFFRWKLQVEKHISHKITSAGDIVECTTNEFDQRYHPPRGVCSKPIPLPTLQHMENILRPNPLSSVLCSTSNDSKRFTIKPLEIPIWHKSTFLCHWYHRWLFHTKLSPNWLWR